MYWEITSRNSSSSWKSRATSLSILYQFTVPAPPRLITFAPQLGLVFDQECRFPFVSSALSLPSVSGKHCRCVQGVLEWRGVCIPTLALSGAELRRTMNIHPETTSSSGRFIIHRKTTSTPMSLLGKVAPSVAEFPPHPDNVQCHGGSSRQCVSVSSFCQSTSAG